MKKIKYIVIVMNFFILSIFLVGCEENNGNSVENADSEVHTNDMIKDEVTVWENMELEKFIRKVINKPDGDVYMSDLDKIEELTVDNITCKMKITTDLSGDNYWYASPFKSLSDFNNFRKLKKLSLLYLKENEENILPMLKCCDTLESLNISQSNFTDISNIVNYSKLSEFYMYEDGLNDDYIKQINSLTNLRHIDINFSSNMDLDLTDLSNLSNLEYLGIYQCNIEKLDYLSEFSKLKVINIAYSKFDYDKLYSYLNLCENMISLDIILNEGEVLDISKINKSSNLEKIKLSGKIINFKNLEHIKEAYFFSMSLDESNTFENLPALKNLCISRGRVKNIDNFKNISSLESIKFEAIDEISSLACLSKNKNMKSVICLACPIKDIEALGNFPKLQKLKISHAELENIDILSKNKELEFLDIILSDNVKNLACLKHLTNLKELHLRGNDLKFGSVLSNLANLKYLDLSFRNMIDINFISELQQLEHLSLHCASTDMSILSNLKNLKTLDLGGIGITELSQLKNLNFLEKLNLRYNGIEDISILKNFSQLRELNLSYNNIKDISILENLHKLEKLSISENPIDEYDLDKFKTNMPNVWIYRYLYL